MTAEVSLTGLGLAWLYRSTKSNQHPLEVAAAEAEILVLRHQLAVISR